MRTWADGVQLACAHAKYFLSTLGLIQFSIETLIILLDTGLEWQISFRWIIILLGSLMLLHRLLFIS